MRTAIVHYWLLKQRGGEKVVDALCRMFPDADVYTLFCDERQLSAEMRKHRIVTSFLNPLRRAYRSLLPLMPVALECFDLRDYDLVISSESGPAKGVITRAGTRHVCYCHTPMRYLWDLYPDYRNTWTKSRLKRAAMSTLATGLRVWDYSCAARVDTFVANSLNVRQRIWRAYRRPAEVVYPPVEADRFYWAPPQDFFLAVSELVPYKRLDSAVRVFGRTGRKLRIVGEGPEFRALRRLAGSNVEFAGRVSDEELADLYSRCRALVMPGEEDFGITPLEALASGKPVIALGRGGVLESVPAQRPLAGVHYPTPDDAALEGALKTFELLEPAIRPAELRACAQRFSETEFRARMTRVLNEDGVPKPFGKILSN
jgi:glycosyltransferase involved in cell wall biosynthesis